MVSIIHSKSSILFCELWDLFKPITFMKNTHYSWWVIQMQMPMVRLWNNLIKKDNGNFFLGIYCFTCCYMCRWLSNVYFWYPVFIYFPTTKPWKCSMCSSRTFSYYYNVQILNTVWGRDPIFFFFLFSMDITLLLLFIRKNILSL